MKKLIVSKLFYLVGTLSPVLFYLAYFRQSAPPLWAAVPLLVLTIFLFGLAFAPRTNLKGTGLFSLLLLIGFFGSLEFTLKDLTPRLPKGVVNTEPLTQPDQVNIVYKKHGFRGVWAKEGPATDAVRIITMGGSSTYGIPMVSPAQTYTAQFARLLEARRPGEKYEVLNGGIAGFGITQIVASLKEELLKYRPQVVTVCAWFNDSAPIPGWYGYSGMSDREAFFLHRTLQRLDRSRLFTALYRSRTFGVFRVAILKLQRRFFASTAKKDGKEEKDHEKKKRMSPEEFAEGLEDVVKLGKEYNFLPVFILEPLSRTPNLQEAKKRNKYYKEVLEVADRHGLPVVNPLDEMSKYRDEFLFHDFIHPNATGHRIVAEALYDTLFQKPAPEALEKFKIEKHIENLPPARLEQHYVFETDGSEEPIQMHARLAPQNESGSTPSVEVLLNGKLLGQANLADAAEQSFELPPPPNGSLLPVNDLLLRAAAPERLSNPKFQIGETGRASPVSISAVSGGKDYGWQVKIAADNVRADLDGAGYNLVAIDLNSGEVVRNRYFDPDRGADQDTELMSELTQLDKKFGKDLAVILAVKGDGRGRANQDILKEAFQFLGGSGRVPERFESFALIGVPHAKPGTAIEQAGRELVTLALGDSEPTAPLVQFNGLKIVAGNGSEIPVHLGD